MTFVKNMKIRSKLFVGFFLILVITAFIAVFGALQIRSVDDAYTNAISYPIARRHILTEIELRMMDARRTMNRASMYASEVYGDGTNEAANARVRNEGIDGQEQHIIYLRDGIVSFVQDFRDSLDSDPVIEPDVRQAQLNNINLIEADALHYIDTYIAQTMQLARDGNSMATIEVTRNAVPRVQSFQHNFEIAYDTATNRVAEISVELEEATVLTMGVLLAFAVIGIVLGILIAVFVSSIIVRPIKGVVSALQDVSEGRLNVNLRADSKDEVGMLTQSAQTLVTTLSDLIHDMDYVTEAHAKGDSTAFMDVNKYVGEYKLLAEHTNAMIEDYLSALQKVVATFSEIANGDFEAQLEQMPGDFVFLNQAVDSMRTQIKNVASGVNGMIEAAADKGDLAYHIDLADFEGDWVGIMQGLNHIAEAVDAPVVEIRRVMEFLSQGDFSHKVEGNYAGDFLAIKGAVNETISVLESYIIEISQVLSEVSGGNLQRAISRSYLGQFAEIKSSINGIVSSLNKTMSEISSASAQVLSGARQISNSATDLANGAQTQASSVQELNASIDIINQQTRQNADNANEADGLSARSASNASEGNDAMKHMLEAMLQIRESSNNISRIIKVIQDIAFQTNLLSLNAAVEAARAGEHGKGFSVVAEEVRNLAARSQTAATETTTLIEDSINRVEVGSGIAESTSESLDTIVKNVSEVSGIINNISRASQEQAEAISQVGSGLSQISQIVQSNSAVSEETAAAAQELNSQAELLQELVSYFKL